MNFFGARDIIDLFSKYLCLAGVLAQIPICLFFPCILPFHCFKLIADGTFFVYFYIYYV